MSPVFAHAGHWAVDLLYLSPLLALAVAVGVGKVRERREERSTKVTEDGA